MRNITYKLMSIGEVQAQIDYTQPLMFDTETIGLYGKIRIAQFYQRKFDVDGTCVVYIVEYPNIVELIQLLNHAIVVGHNIHYDITTIQDNMGGLPWQPDVYHDTFLMSRLYFYTKNGFALDNVIHYTIGEDVYGNSKSFYHSTDWSIPVLSDGHYTYASKDVAYLHDVWDLISETQNDINYKLDMLFLKYALKFQTRGMPVDMDKLNARYAENAQKINELALPINCNSYMQVRQYINSVMSDDKGLAILSYQGNEKAAKVREVRKLTKQNSFLAKFAETAINDRIRGKFKPSASSGRSTSDDQNLQQLPRKLKSIFGLPENGDRVLIYSDFAQIQLRNVCVIARDRRMEALFRAGEDLHDFVARFIFGENFTKENRQVCKTANFSLLFGAGQEALRTKLLQDSGMYLTEHEATEIKKKWSRLWQQITEWQNKGIKDWKKGIAWETPLGRRYTSKLMTDQLAMQLQGFEAEVAKLAMHYMFPKLEALEDTYIVNFIHDSFIIEAPNKPEVYELASKVVGDAMLEAWKEMSQSVPVSDLPMPVKVRVGWNWGDIEDGIFIHEYKTI